MAGSAGQFSHLLGTYWRVQELLKMTNDNNTEGMTIIQIALLLPRLKLFGLG